MRRTGFGLFLVLCALAGASAAAVFAGASPASILQTTATTTTVTTTTPTTTGTTTVPTTTTPTTTRPTTTSPDAPLPAGVTVGGVAVGGLRPSAAFSVVRTAFEAPLVVIVPRSRLTPRPTDLGATAYVDAAIDRARKARPGTAVKLFVRVRGARVRAYVARIATRFEREPVDARLFLRGLRPFVTKDVPGRAIDRKAATAAIIRALVRNERFALTMPTRRVPAAVRRSTIGPVIVIRRGSNRLTLYDGMKVKRAFGVATGEDRYPTPLGRFRVIVKWRNPWWYPPDSEWARGQKPVPPGPGNPLGTRWMGISAPGVGIHGTPDSASIGYSVSHGCIRMHIPDAEWLFNEVTIGTTVFIVAA